MSDELLVAAMIVSGFGWPAITAAVARRLGVL